MTPSARLQAGIDLLDAIISAATSNGPAADTLIARYFKERRYAGSKDRRAVRDHVYAAIRAHTLPPASGRAAMVALAQRDAALAALFDGSTHAPPPIGDAEWVTDAASHADPMPVWLLPLLADLVDGPERAALLERAPLHLRVNALKAERTALLAALPDATRLANTPHGIALPEGTALESTPEWQAGLIEVQDAGSQIIAAACQARPGQTVLDLCAGAGGKTLALAGDMAQGFGAVERAREGRLIA
ncbi:MAG TPA: RsmB/NOP family class I SAM-dependent RNA methyltransferase, partial [Sphingobium sp.]